MSFLKVVEGFGLVAGLNKTNDVDKFVVIYLVETEYSCREVVNNFSIYDYYDTVLSDMRTETRRAKRRGGDFIAPLEFWGMEENRFPGNEILAREFAERNDGVYGGTIEEYKEHEREQKRLELESTAKELAAKFQVKLSSLEFIEKLNDAIRGVEYGREDWNNPERRAEEWAACQYSGGGSEVYFDDLNFENGRFSERMDEYLDILEWLQDECPLLMCKYEELKMKEESE